jgi:hypothetical protein
MRRGGARLAAALLALLVAGCSTRQFTISERSAVEQELIVRALERAVARLDTHALAGHRVTLDLHGLTKDAAFAKAFVGARLAARGVTVAADAAHADRRLEVFASILGIDRGESFLGIPAVQVPVFAVPIPEIPIFKWVRNRGRAEVQVYAYDAASGRFVDRIPDGVGRSKFDEFTLLLVLSFSVSDLDERPGEAGGDAGER